MNIHSDSQAMCADHTAHTAVHVRGGWRLSWLPDRLLDRDQAITGMALAETVAREHPRPGDLWWLFLQAWAAELGLTVDDAIARVCQPPVDPGPVGGEAVTVTSSVRRPCEECGQPTAARSGLCDICRSEAAYDTARAIEEDLRQQYAEATEDTEGLTDPRWRQGER